MERKDKASSGICSAVFSMIFNCLLALPRVANLNNCCLKRRCQIYSSGCVVIREQAGEEEIATRIVQIIYLSGDDYI